jgi:replicative DNA helicase
MAAKPLFISVEDGVALSLKRLMARRAKVNAIRLRNNQCTKEDLAAMKRELLRAERIPFFVDAVGVPVEDICAFIRQHCKEHGSALVVVDYLQKLRSKKRGQDRRIEVGDNAMMLADSIKEANAAGLLLSQLARPDKNKPDAEPGMYDLKEAGEIENACEHVLIGHTRKESIQGSKQELKIRTIRILKNKDGPVFDETIDQAFDEVTASFKETGGQVTDQGDDEVSGTPAWDQDPPEDDPRFSDP